MGIRIFAYSGLSEKRSYRCGILKAVSRKEAIIMLSESGICAICIVELLLPHDIFSPDLRKKHLAISEFFGQLHFLIFSGVSITEALHIMDGAAGYANRYSKAISSNINKGASISEAMKQAESYFPGLAIEVMAYAENSGRIENICKKLSEYYYSMYSIKREVKSALSYPMLVLFFCFFSVGFIVVFVMPSLSDLFSASDVGLDGASGAIIEVSRFVNGNMHMLLAGMAGIVFIAACFYRALARNDGVWRLLSKVPHIGKIRSNAISSMFAGLLSMSMESGIPVYSAVEMARNALECSEYRKSMLKIKDSIAAGESMSMAIAGADFFPEEFAAMVKIGEGSGDLSRMMHKISCYFEKQMECSIKRAVSLVGPLLIMGVTAIIGVVSYVVMTPMLRIANSII